MPFPDHLCPDEYLRSTLLHTSENLLVRLPLPGGIMIHSCECCMWGEQSYSSFNLLSSKSEPSAGDSAALRTTLWWSLSIIAVMATHLAIRSVVDERHAAMRTPHSKAALAAEQQPGVSPSIKKQQDLFPLLQRFFDRVGQPLGEDEWISCSLSFRFSHTPLV
jgi:hypothetical protein